MGASAVAERGGDRREYPWGNQEPDPGRANYDDTKLGWASPVGLFPRGSTPDGITDLAGNVWEWVADWYDDSKDSRVLRGGSWGNEPPRPERDPEMEKAHPKRP